MLKSSEQVKNFIMNNNYLNINPTAKKPGRSFARPSISLAKVTILLKILLYKV